MPLAELKSSEKSAYVNNMFSKIASKYDLLNNLMTFGRHLAWKRTAVMLSLKEVTSPLHALDVCSGTGDLALIIKSMLPDTKVIATDNCKNMLSILEEKIEKLNIQGIDCELVSAESLDYKENSFDLISIGFGLRNLVNREKFLNKAFSILKSGGVFMCIDLGFPEIPVWREVFFLYFFKFVPLMGEIFAKDKEAYSYLPESLKTWYKQKELKQILLNTGFSRCYYKNIFGGVVAIHIAVKR